MAFDREEREALERLLRKEKKKEEKAKNKNNEEEENEEESEEKESKRKESDEDFGFSESFAQIIDIPTSVLKPTEIPEMPADLEEIAGSEREGRRENGREGRNERNARDRRVAEEREEIANYSLTTYEQQEQSRDVVASMSDMRRTGMFVRRTGADSMLERPSVEMPTTAGGRERMSQDNLVKYVEERRDPWKTDELIEKRQDLKKYRKRM